MLPVVTCAIAGAQLQKIVMSIEKRIPRFVFHLFDIDQLPPKAYDDSLHSSHWTFNAKRKLFTSVNCKIFAQSL